MEQSKKIERIAEILDISSLKVKRVLDLPIKDCYALSAEKAKEIFEGAEDEEEKFAALLKWMALTEDREDVISAFRSVDNDSEEEVIVLRRLLGLSTDAEQIFEAFDYISSAVNDLIDPSSVYQNLFQTALSSALAVCQSASQARELWDYENLSDESRELVFLTWLRVCQTKGDFEDMLSEFDEDDDGERAKIELINQQWQTLFEARVNQVYDFNTGAATYAVCLPVPESKEKVIIKWLQFCSSAEQVEVIYEKIDSEEYSSAVETEMIRRLYQLL